MYKRDLNATIDETLQGISALSPNAGEIPSAETLHSYVSDQIDKLEEKYRYYTLQDLNPSESSSGPRVTVKSYKVLTPKSSKSKRSMFSSDSEKRFLDQGSYQGYEEEVVDSDDYEEEQDEPERHREYQKLGAAFKKLQINPKKANKILVKHQKSYKYDKTALLNLTKYKPKKNKSLRHMAPAEKRTPLVKWRPVEDNPFWEFGDKSSPDMNMTSEQVASIALEDKSRSRSNSEALNLLPITCKSVTHKTRVVPCHIRTSQLHDLSKLELEYLNMKLSLEGYTVTENAFKDYRDVFHLCKSLRGKLLTTEALNRSIATEVKDNIEHELDLVEPEVHDMFQLRGSGNPSWCPGFFISVPNQASPFEVTQLDQILAKVWREMSPLRL